LSLYRNRSLLFEGQPAPIGNKSMRLEKAMYRLWISLVNGIEVRQYGLIKHGDPSLNFIAIILSFPCFRMRCHMRHPTTLEVPLLTTSWDES